VVARSQYGARNQACSQPKVPASRCVARCSNCAPSIHGNCQQQNIGSAVVVQTIDNFVICLPHLLPLDHKLIGMAKSTSANSP
jgi:hypothetical protein